MRVMMMMMMNAGDDDFNGDDDDVENTYEFRITMINKLDN